MGDHEREQDIVEPLDPLPSPRFEGPECPVAGGRSERGDDEHREEAGPVREPEACGQDPRPVIRFEEVAEDAVTVIDEEPKITWAMLTVAAMMPMSRVR